VMGVKGGGSGLEGGAAVVVPMLPPHRHMPDALPPALIVTTAFTTDTTSLSMVLLQPKHTPTAALPLQRI
jgi:hypothetical protein